VTSNKTVQEAVRAFGQSPTNYAIERALDEVARHRGLDRVEVRRRNLIRSDEFPYLIPSGTTYDSGDYHAVIEKVLARADYASLVAERDRLRDQRLLAGIGIAACLEPSGANSTFEPLLNPKNETTTYTESCRINVDVGGAVTATIHTLSAGQGHETLTASAIGEVLEIDPDRIRVVRPDSLAALPSQSPVGSRMAIMLGGAAFHAAQKLKERLVAIGAHDLAIPRERATYSNGDVGDAANPSNRRSWAELVTIAHRNFHKLPPGTEPGLAFAHVLQVPTGGRLPSADGRVQMYPCFAFEFHLLLLTIDPDLGKTEIRRYLLGHDCGTVINPKIVRGMTMGGVAHGIGAALFEEFAYNGDGQLLAQSFMDYLLPSAQEIPPVEIVEHVTPSPHTVFGQKGSGEAGYLGAPAAIASAVNDALAPLGLAVNGLPIKMTQLADTIAARRRPTVSS
jgi:2-furoyl-CoA dehydrogenase large subunit